MKFFNALLKWFLVILAGLSAALVAIILLSRSSSINQFLLRLVILLAIGFVGGVVERLFFHKTSVLLSILMVLTASLISLLMIDLFYETPYQLDVFSTGLVLRNFSIGDGSQIFFMSLASLMPLLFMRKSSRRAAPVQQARAVKPGKSLAEALKPYLYQINPANWQILKSKPKRKQQIPRNSTKPPTIAAPKTKTSSNAEKPIKPASTVTIVRSARKAKPASRVKAVNEVKPAKAKSAAKKLKLPAKIFGRNNSDVKLVGEEEHVCPYCLEEVVKGDSQGVVVCPECGPWHHQDCWNLTGSCGVAHRNEL